MLESLLIALLIIAVVCFIIGILPLDMRAKQIMYVVVAIVAIIWLVRLLGVTV